MDDMNKRQELMQTDTMLVATAALSLLNGMHFSPWFDPIALLLKPFVAGTFLASPLVFLYLTSIFISLVTLMLAGIPAAIYERARGLAASSPTSIGIWLVAVIALTLPSLLASIRG
jgi:ABC-type transport system involved in multi-copper enzyme maturation permease subunit